MCEKIENKFFTDGNAFLFGEKPTIVDYVIYQELLSAMILSGNGSTQEFLAEEESEKQKKFKNLASWYKQMAKIKACKEQADEFIRSMNIHEDSGLNISSDSQRTRKSNSEKRVHFAPNKQVKFSSDHEINEWVFCS